MVDVSRRGSASAIEPLATPAAWAGVRHDGATASDVGCATLWEHADCAEPTRVTCDTAKVTGAVPATATPDEPWEADINTEQRAVA